MYRFKITNIQDSLKFRNRWTITTQTCIKPGPEVPRFSANAYQMSAGELTHKGIAGKNIYLEETAVCIFAWPFRTEANLQQLLMITGNVRDDTTRNATDRLMQNKHGQHFAKCAERRTVTIQIGAMIISYVEGFSRKRCTCFEWFIHSILSPRLRFKLQNYGTPIQK